MFYACGKMLSCLFCLQSLIFSTAESNINSDNESVPIPTEVHSEMQNALPDCVPREIKSKCVCVPVGVGLSS